MSAGIDPGASGGGDFELNLAPIIDCMTVLIAFMLISFTALSIGLLDAGVSAAGAAPQDKSEPPPVTLMVEIQKNHQLVLKVSGKQNLKREFTGSTDWDFEPLSQELAKIKTQFPSVTALTLSAQDDVEYVNVVKGMDTLRKTIPVVLLGGF